MLRKLFLAFATSLLAYSQVSAFCCSFLPEVAESSLDIGVGYRQDRIEWKTHAFGITEKQKWDNLRIWEISLAGKYVTCDDVYFRGYIDYGWVTGGHLKDRENAFGSDSSSGFGDTLNLFSNGSSGGRRKARGYVYDASIALGYQFRWCEESLAFSPLLGYSWHGQHLDSKRRGYDDYSYSYDSCSDDYYYYYYNSKAESNFTDMDNFSGCGSNKNKYHARWNGPWLGFDLEYAIWCDWTIFFDYEYHWAQYHAKSHRPLFAGLSSAAQRSNNAHGQRFVLGTTWDFCECWTAALTGEFSFWNARRGRERIRVADVSADDLEVEVLLKSRLKDIKWETAAITLGLGYAF